MDFATSTCYKAPDIDFNTACIERGFDGFGPDGCYRNWKPKPAAPSSPSRGNGLVVDPEVVLSGFAGGGVAGVHRQVSSEPIIVCATGYVRYGKECISMHQPADGTYNFNKWCIKFRKPCTGDGSDAATRVVTAGARGAAYGAIGGCASGGAAGVPGGPAGMAAGCLSVGGLGAIGGFAVGVVEYFW
jgi:hypothetical protein